MKSFRVKIIVASVYAMVLTGIAVSLITKRSDDSVRQVVSQKSNWTQLPARPHNQKSQTSGSESLSLTPLPPLPPTTHHITSLPNTIEFDATQDFQQAGHWLANEDRYDLTKENQSDSIQEHTDPNEIKTESDDSDDLALWDVENSPQETSEGLDDLEPSSPDEKDAEQSTDEAQPAPAASEDSEWTTDRLFDQIRNQRATAAQHEIRWSLNDAIMAALIYSNRVSSLQIESVEELQNVGVQSGPFDVVGFAEHSFRDSTEPVGSTIDTATGCLLYTSPSPRD